MSAVYIAGAGELTSRDILAPEPALVAKGAEGLEHKREVNLALIVRLVSVWNLCNLYVPL